MNSMSSAFGSGNASASATIQEGSEVPEIQTQRLGFKTLHGDKKAKVLPNAWPDNALPPPYASLLSVASARGLFAAAGPDALFIGRTQDARKKIYETSGPDIRDCDPIHSIPHSRLGHVAFAADESCLVVAEENSPEIIAYGTPDLIAKGSSPALKQSTNAPIRAIAPNPDPAQAQYFALLNANGQLLLADLGQGQLVSGANGPVLAENVSCIAWSTKGKQLMAGKGDGTAVQLKPDGSVVATVGKPSSVPANCHLAQIAWIENDVFLFIYTPSSAPEDISSLVSEYYIVKTNKDRSEFNFHKFPMDLVFPMVPRAPAHFHISRLRNYAPHLDELLILATSVSSEIKLITKTSEPLSDELSEKNAYAFTTPDDDGRLASTPMGQDGATDTTAIGMAIDLSDNDPVVAPLPTDPEFDNSFVPLPELMALNTEGLLSIWAVVYDDGVRTKQPYPGITDIAKIRTALDSAPQEEDMDSAPTTSAPTEPPKTANGLSSASNTNITSSSNQQTSVFSQPSFGTGSGFSKPNPIGGDTKSWTSTGFGTTSQPQSSPFGQTPSFGSTPALGSASKPAFGQAGSLGGSQQSSAPAFGQSGFGQKSAPAFGQSGFGAQSGQGSPFASAGKTPSTSSPFAGAGGSSSGGFSSFANQGGGFSAINKDVKTESSFAKFGSGGGFGDAKSGTFGTTSTNNQSPFAQASGTSAFSKPSASPFGGVSASAPSPFGQAGKSGFKLESTFQKDQTSKEEDDSKPDSGAGFGFGRLGSMLGSAPPPALQSPTKEEEMEDDSSSATEVETSSKPQETPPTTINQPKTTTTPHIQSLFGQQASTTPQTQPKSSLGTGFNFGTFGGFQSTTPKEAPAPSTSIFGTKSTSDRTPAVVQKSEPSKPFFSHEPASKLSDSDRVKSLSDEDESESTKVPDAPLPPDPFSKPGYQAGDTSASSLNSKGSKEPEDAPLPPDFFPANKTASQSLKTQDSEIPSEILSDDFDDDEDDESAEDVTGDVSPVGDKASDQSGPAEEQDHVQTSPESSYGRISDQSPVDSPTGGPFTKVSKVEQSKPSRTLFGEMSAAAPMFPPPQPKPQESPRSPSPMRKPPRQAMLARSPERSFSAPAHPRSLIKQRKEQHQQSALAAQAAKAREEEMVRERARMEAARKAQEAAKAAETQPLFDDEDAVLQEELAKPTQPSENLDPFITIQPGKALQETDETRTDIPSQIEKLYQDINSMIITLGINAKSLSAYLMYQVGHRSNEVWPNVLGSDTPMDALNDEWFLGDVDSLPAGSRVLSTIVDGLEIKDVLQKLEDCQNLLTNEITDLRGRITALRRSTQARAQPENNLHAPLSAEQMSIQQDLRKSSAVVTTNLAQVEDNLVILRAKLADLAPSKSPEKQGMFGLMSNAQKKPSVEAVMNTVTKMTAMAEKRSADVDVLEAQLKKLNLPPTHVAQPSTPERKVSRKAPATPMSGASSVYHTPDSREARSARVTPAKSEQMMISMEDREKWQAKARRRKDVASTLKAVLQEKHGKTKA